MAVYPNRATRIRLSEVYCEVDSGSATLNLVNDGKPLLVSNLTCTPSGSASTSFFSGREIVERGERVRNQTAAVVPGAHRVTVVVSFIADDSVSSATITNADDAKSRFDPMPR